MREFNSTLVVLVATNKCVYRILLTHQNASKRKSILGSYLENDSRGQISSYDYSKQSRDNKVVSVAFWFHSSLHCSFVISCSNHILIKLKMDESGDVRVLHKSFATSALLGILARKPVDVYIPSLLIAHSRAHHYVFSVCSNAKLQVFTLDGLNLVFESDLKELMTFDSSFDTGEIVGSEFKIKKCEEKTPSGLDGSLLPLMCVFIKFENLRSFLFLRLVSVQ